MKYEYDGLMKIIRISKVNHLKILNKENIILAYQRDGHTVPGVCGNGSVPLSHSGNIVTRFGIHTHTWYANKGSKCRGQLLKKGICSSRSKFFPLRVDPMSKNYREANKNSRNTS